LRNWKSWSNLQNSTVTNAMPDMYTHSLFSHLELDSRLVVVSASHFIDSDFSDRLLELSSTILSSMEIKNYSSNDSAL